MDGFPAIAFGTMEGYGCEPEALYEATKHAIEAGYTAIDTAESYASAQHVGRAIRDSGKRDSLWVISKLKGLPCGSYESVRERAQTHLATLGLAAFDVLLVHFPARSELDLSSDPSDDAVPWSFFVENVASAWRNMLQLRADGLAKHVGVSNFYQQHLTELLKHCPQESDRPEVNQIFVDAVHQEAEFVAEMQALGLRVMAYRVAAFAGVYGMIEDVSSALAEVAKEASLGGTQELLVAWAAGRGLTPVVKSTNVDHLKGNLAAAACGDKVPLQAMKQLDGNEMVDMYGGVDEYAMMFKRMGPS